MAKAHLHGDEATGVQLDQVVVPFLDMSFQLLFFLIITFNPGKQEGAMAMNLPATGEATAKDQSQVDLNKSSDIELNVPSDFVVKVTSKGGGIDSLVVRDAEKVVDIGADKSATERLKELYETLKTKLDERKKDNPKAADNIKIEADSTLKYALLVDVMDACIRAGYQQVGFAPPPDLGR